MSLLVHVGPDAAGQVGPVRRMLPRTGAASLPQDDCIVLRLLVPDSHELRAALLPLPDRPSRDRLPTSWRV